MQINQYFLRWLTLFQLVGILHAASSDVSAGGVPAVPGASAAAYSAKPGVPEEGWRWRYGLSHQIKGKPIEFDALHNRMSDLEQSLSDIARASLSAEAEERPGSIKNYVLGALTVVWIDDKDELNCKSIPIHKDGRCLVFEHGMETSLTAETSVGHHKFIGLAGDYFSLNPHEFKQSLYELFHSLPAGAISEREKSERLTEVNKLNRTFALRLIRHSEQFMRLFLLNRSNLVPLVGDLIKDMPLGAKIQCVILHIHSRLDMCKRCSQTWSAELNSRGGVFDSIKALIEKEVSAKGVTMAPEFRSLVLATSRETYVQEDRRGKAGHDSANYYVKHDLLNRAMPPFMQKIILPHYRPDASAGGGASSGEGGSGPSRAGGPDDGSAAAAAGGATAKA